MASKLRLADRIKENNCDGNEWLFIQGLAAKHAALNMSLGKPDFRPPDDVLNALSDAATGENHMINHYARPYGHPRLVNALARLYSITLEREIDPMANINVTVGAIEALYCSFMGLINPGDEVILIEPFYLPYKDMIHLSGGVPIYIPLRPKKKDTSGASSDWLFDPEIMTKAFNKKTKVILINNPSNPLGKVYTQEELNLICNLCTKYDVICVADEVYEWLVYGEKKHIRIATLPGMWERTITIGSGGKTFSVTGWKVGWAIGPENFINGVKSIHSIIVKMCPTPTQEAIAVSIEKELTHLNSEKCYFNRFPKELESKRDLLCKCLKDVGIDVVKPDGGYFIVADISKLDTNGFIKNQDPNEAYDFRFVKWAITEKKFCMMPVSTCYSPEHRNLGEKYVRICFVKDDKTLEKARDILQKWKTNKTT